MAKAARKEVVRKGGDCGSVVGEKIISNTLYVGNSIFFCAKLKSGVDV